MSHVIYGRQIIPEGEIIPATGDIAQRVAAFGLLIDRDVDIQECLDSVYNTYRVLDENGNSMVISKYRYEGEKNEK